MHISVLTGGIATGKSTAARFFQEVVPSLVLFDSDAAVHRLLANHDSAIAEIAAVFGGGIISQEGGINRKKLRTDVFGRLDALKKLENILHPLVRQECLASLAEAARVGVSWYVADIPLFFEKSFSIGEKEVIVIATSRTKQIERLKQRNGFDDSLIESILASQLTLEQKMARADFVFWNEGSPSILQTQISRFAQSIS